MTLRCGKAWHFPRDCRFTNAQHPVASTTPDSYSRVPESLSNIFQDSSPKVFFRYVSRIFGNLSLSADSRFFYSQSLLGCERCISHLIPNLLMYQQSSGNEQELAQVEGFEMNNELISGQSVNVNDNLKKNVAFRELPVSLILF